jgi:hypothetical protein
MKVARAIDLELTRAEVEVRELEARLRVVPMNDNQLSDALRVALAAKQERLDKLRAVHAAASKPRPERAKTVEADGLDGLDGAASRKIPLHGGHRTPLKRTIPQRSKPAGGPAKGKTAK